MNFGQRHGSGSAHKLRHVARDVVNCAALFVCLLPWLLSGCASPGEPYERKPPEPAAVADLSAVQSGNNAVLTFTPPKETSDHRELSRPFAVQIYRRVQPSLATQPF